MSNDVASSTNYSNSNNNNNNSINNQNHDENSGSSSSGSSSSSISKRMRQNQGFELQLAAPKRARRSLASSSSCRGGGGSDADHSRCLYITGAFKSGNGDLLNRYRRCYAPQYNLTSSTSSSSVHHSSIPSSVLCNSCIPPMIALNRARTINEPVMSLANSDKFNRANCNKCLYKSPDTLLEIAAKAVAANVAFESVEQHSSRIPIPVQERIIFWSFPRDDSFLRLYSSISSILVRNKFSSSVESELQSIASSNGFSNYQSQHASSGESRQTSNSSSSSSRQSANRHHVLLMPAHNRPEPLPSLGRLPSIFPPSGLSPENRQEIEQQQLVSLFKAGDVILAKGTVKNVIQIGFTLSGIVGDGLADKNYLYDISAVGSLPSQASSMLHHSGMGGGGVGGGGGGAALMVAPPPPLPPLPLQPQPHLHPQQALGAIQPLPAVPHHLPAPYSSSSRPSWHSSLGSSLSQDYSGRSYSSSVDQYSVSISFEKCKITQVHCTCNSKRTLIWCEHVVALALHRIRKPYDMELRLPISESIDDLDRDQLKKLLLYVISEHHVQVLPTVQKLIDEMQNKQSRINQIGGAPDPTAGSCALAETHWFLNESQLKSQINSLVKNIGYSESSKLMLLFQRFSLMLKIQDSNAQRFLQIITNEFLNTYRLSSDFSNINFDPFAFLWDNLVNLWVAIVCDPRLPEAKRQRLRDLFYNYNIQSSCPYESNYFKLEFGTSTAWSVNYAKYQNYLNNNNNEPSSPSSPSPPSLSPPSMHQSSRTHSSGRMSHVKIFQRAIEASHLQWNDPLLELITRHDNFHSLALDGDDKLSLSVRGRIPNGLPVWSEHLPTAAVRIATLRTNGMKQEALRLAVAVVRHLTLVQESNKLHHDASAAFCLNAANSWIGNPFDPVGVIFDTLAEASLKPGSKTLDQIYRLFGYDKKVQKNNLLEILVRQDINELGLIAPEVYSAVYDSRHRSSGVPKYHHVPIPGSPNESYMTMAVKVAFIGLTQYRQSPDLDSQRDIFFRQELRLIQKLLDINWQADPLLIDVLKTQAIQLIESGLLSDHFDPCLRSTVPIDIVQIPALAHLLFCVFHSKANAKPREELRELAFSVGMRSIRHMAIKNQHSTLGVMFNHYIDLQLFLVKTMLFSARDDPRRLDEIEEALKNYLNSPHYLSQLTQEIFTLALRKNRYPHLLRVAYHLGLHLCVMTMGDANTDMNRRLTIPWLVICATEIGYESVFNLVHKWGKYFTPYEAVTGIGSNIHTKSFRSPVDALPQKDPRNEELKNAVRELAVQCTAKDPANCAISAMTICHKDPDRYNEIVRIVEIAGMQFKMNPQQLFAVARLMETILHPVGQDTVGSNNPALSPFAEHTCRIALLAVKSVVIPISWTSPHTMSGELQWTCELILLLRKEKLTEFIEIVIQNIHCATILSDILRRCMAHQFNENIGGQRKKAFFDSIANQGDLSHLVECCRVNFDYRKEPLRKLMDKTVNAYIETILQRLDQISPRHYCDFITYLAKAKEIITLKPKGNEEFEGLIKQIKQNYKGKKKLIQLVKEKFQ